MESQIMVLEAEPPWECLCGLAVLQSCPQRRSTGLANDESQLILCAVAYILYRHRCRQRIEG